MKHDVHKSVTGKTFIYEFDYPLVKKLKTLTKSEGYKYLSTLTIEELEEPIIRDTSFVRKTWENRKQLEDYLIRKHHRKIHPDEIDLLYFLQRSKDVKDGYRLLSRYTFEELKQSMKGTELFTHPNFIATREKLEKFMVDVYVKTRITYDMWEKNFQDRMMLN